MLGGSDGEVKPKGKRKFVTREEEPDQSVYYSTVRNFAAVIFFNFSVECTQKLYCRFWQTAGEREGENPMKTPLPYIIIFGMSTPFVFLAIAFANGWIKMPVR